MATLSADRETARKEAGVKSFPVYIATAIFKGGMVCINSSGYLVAASDTSGDHFVGVAMEGCTAAQAVASGTVWIKVYTTGVFDFTAIGLSQALVGDLMYVLYDNTFVVVGYATNDIICGKLVEYVSSTRGWIDIGNRVAS